MSPYEAEARASLARLREAGDPRAALLAGAIKFVALAHWAVGDKPSDADREGLAESWRLTALAGNTMELDRHLDAGGHLQ